MIEPIIASAIAKRDRIIAREGDANGKRLSLDYLARLIIDEYKILTLKEELENAIKTKKLGVAKLQGCKRFED